MAFDQVTQLKSHDYWEKRALNMALLTHHRADKTVAMVCRNYDQAQKNIIAQIEKIFARYVNNNEALNAEKALQLLSQKQTAEYRQALTELYHSTTDPKIRNELRARLEAPAYANRISGLQAVRDGIYADCLLLSLPEAKLVTSRLLDTLEQSYYRQTFEIQKGIKTYYDFKKLSNRQMQAIIAQKWEGKNYSGRIWNNNKKFARAVENTVAAGILSGQSFNDMSDRLLHVIGMTEKEGAKYNAARLIRTECNRVATQGQILGYKTAEIEYYIYLATLDMRTSDICISLDLKKFPLSEAQEGNNLPPMHPNCRSTTMPDIDLSVLSRIWRSARDPQTGKTINVPPTMNYAEWYEKYVKGS